MKEIQKTRIVATLGPSTTTKEDITKLFRAGAEVFRLNFSHGSWEDHQKRFDAVREVENKAGRPLAIIMDIQGPKLRVGTFAKGAVKLVDGANFQLDLEKTPGDETRVNMPHPEIFQAVQPGTLLLLDDGRIRLEVIENSEKSAKTRVVTGGKLSDRKGVNVPNVILPLSALTEKDHKDLEFGLNMGVDWVALSFVQRPEDIAYAKTLIQGRAGIIAKIEKPSAVEHLQAIVEESDAIMVARGDLGVEIPTEDVPIYQRQLVKACRKVGRPVIIATQMLDSMVNQPIPTRAEASDVANAVYSGADAVMLSAETATGEYPFEAVALMSRIIKRVQSDPGYAENLAHERPKPNATAPDAISAAVRQIGETMTCKAIVTYTTSGSTTLRLCRERPDLPIVSLTPREDTARRMVLAWGVHSCRAPDANDLEDMMQTATHQTRIDGFSDEGDKIVITAGVPFSIPGKTNLLRIATVHPTLNKIE